MILNNLDFITIGHFYKFKVIAKHTKVDMIWVAGRSPTLVSQNLKATTLTYLAIAVAGAPPPYLVLENFWMPTTRKLTLIK